MAGASSGCTPSVQVSPSSSSRLVPVKRSQPAFTNVTRPLGSVVHIITGACRPARGSRPPTRAAPPPRRAARGCPWRDPRSRRTRPEMRGAHLQRPAVGPVAAGQAILEAELLPPRSSPPGGHELVPVVRVGAQAEAAPSSSSTVRPVNRSQPSLTKATWPSASVIHMSGQRRRARGSGPLSRTSASRALRSAAAPRTSASDWRKSASFRPKRRDVRP